MSEKQRDQIQLSYGRKIDWEAANPILLSGEMACVFDNDTLQPIDIKFGNGVDRFTQLPSLINKDKVYEKEQVDEMFENVTNLIQQLTATDETILTDLDQIKTVTIPAIQQVIDEAATDENKLTAISTVNSLIMSMIDSRFGRQLYSNEEGSPFESTTALQDGPWYHNGIQISELVTNDKATVTGYDYGFKWDGSEWEPDTDSLLLTPEQQAALDSGITTGHVRMLERLNTENDQNKQDIQQLQSTTADSSEKVEQISTTVEELSEKAATKIVSRYKNTATIRTAGTGYTQYTRCAVGTLTGIITEVTEEGGIVSILLNDTSTNEAVASSTPIVAGKNNTAACTVASQQTTYDLSDVDSYLQQLLEVTSKTNLSRGYDDDKLKVVRNGELTDMFVSGTMRYVDSSFDGTEEGTEIAPFKTGAAAIASVLPAETCTIIFAAGAYNEELSFTSLTNKNLVGYAIGHLGNTSISELRTNSGTSNVGFRDLTFGSMSISGGTDIYFDNVSVTGTSALSTTGSLYFVHCNFIGSVTVGGGTVEFDSCTFSNSSQLIVQGDARVIVRNGVNVTPSIMGGSYLQLSGSVSPTSTGGSYSVTASSGASFVGLFDGVSVNSTNAYAPISIGAGVRFAIGTFLFDFANSSLPDDTYRSTNDGLSGSQVIVSKKVGEQAGYTADSIYLSDHLDAISRELKDLSTNIVAGAMTKVDLAQGSENGKLKIIAYSGDEPVYTSPEVAVPGLGSAAYTNSTQYATSAQGAKADTAYQKPGSGIPQTDLDYSIRSVLENAETRTNRATVVNSTSTDTTYPTARAVYTYGSDLVTNLKTELSQTYVTQSELEEIQTGGRFITSNDGKDPSLSSRFESLEQLNSTEVDHYYAGNKISWSSLRDGDYAYYKYIVHNDESDEDIDTTRRAIFGRTEQSSQFSDTGEQANQFNSSQLAAINSGVTSTIVEKLGDIVTGISGSDTVLSTLNKKQDKVPAAQSGQLMTHSGTEGQIGTPRSVFTGYSTSTPTTSREYSSADAHTTFSVTAVSDANSIPSATSVASLITALSTWVTSELNKKEDNLPYHSNGTGWLKATNGTMTLLSGQNFKTAIQQDLGDDYYLTVTDAAATYPNLHNLEEEGLLKGVGDTNPEVVPIASSVTSGSSDIPTSGAVYSHVDSIRSNLQNQINGKQATLSGTSGNIITYGGSAGSVGSLSTFTNLSNLSGDLAKIPTGAVISALNEEIKTLETEVTKKLAVPTSTQSSTDYSVVLLDDSNNAIKGPNLQTLLDTKLNASIYNAFVAGVSGTLKENLDDKLTVPTGLTSTSQVIAITGTDGGSYQTSLVALSQVDVGSQTIRALEWDAGSGIQIASNVVWYNKEADSAVKQSVPFTYESSISVDGNDYTARISNFNFISSSFASEFPVPAYYLTRSGTGGAVSEDITVYFVDSTIPLQLPVSNDMVFLNSTTYFYSTQGISGSTAILTFKDSKASFWFNLSDSSASSISIDNVISASSSEIHLYGSGLTDGKTVSVTFRDSCPGTKIYIHSQFIYVYFASSVTPEADVYVYHSGSVYDSAKGKGNYRYYRMYQDKYMLPDGTLFSNVDIDDGDIA